MVEIGKTPVAQEWTRDQFLTALRDAQGDHAGVRPEEVSDARRQIQNAARLLPALDDYTTNLETGVERLNTSVETLIQVGENEWSKLAPESGNFESWMTSQLRAVHGTGKFVRTAKGEVRALNSLGQQVTLLAIVEQEVKDGKKDSKIQRLEPSHGGDRQDGMRYMTCKQLKSVCCSFKSTGIMSILHGAWFIGYPSHLASFLSPLPPVDRPCQPLWSPAMSRSTMPSRSIPPQTPSPVTRSGRASISEVLGPSSRLP
ncbi:hypothetical protein ABEF92_002171 [Exophiala dermatitidis]|uniref:Uncharacterized protein n=1 Tax=Exophiala dermatitidis (strain ATCC 34100 / CBS 525.76 / NIH/UT8656) TaxID=858893 RepID=H6BYN9_EXODN|nr:uncharacterized protein HMPREF1120_04819 [Exophiala dermatitidis NIH/UT8656]EHY56752.1 hypothetical protein HMPREF1120_04819 [Exophiala dermatitidis NIH/UT8656]KAJ4520197.1 hypothetical protein HRR75_002060 [Exophiala dermatitidis]KAJ4556433.1 hypothetical protein HRR78_002094 [Exophiala dermatitidis]